MWREIIIIGFTALTTLFFASNWSQENPHQQRPSQQRPSQSSTNQTRKKKTKRGSNSASATLRETLNYKLISDSATCNICMDLLERKNPIFTCSECLNIFHLQCVQTWARYEMRNQCRWPCSNCRNYEYDIPVKYLCLCGQTENPPIVEHRVPHSCGKLCDGCSSPCHPGVCYA